MAQHVLEHLNPLERWRLTRAAIDGMCCSRDNAATTPKTFQPIITLSSCCHTELQRQHDELDLQLTRTQQEHQAMLADIEAMEHGACTPLGAFPTPSTHTITHTQK